jgi:hypothetical protein
VRRSIVIALGVVTAGLALAVFAALTWEGRRAISSGGDTRGRTPPAEPALFGPQTVVATRAGPVAPDAASAPNDNAPDEAALMDRLRKIEDGDPTLALQLAREGDARFPGGADAAERAMIVVKSLARQGDLSEARGKAESMVNVYAGTRWALEVEQHMGAHPHRSR